MVNKYLYGLVASLLLLTFYFATLTILNSFEHALSQFYGLWYLILPLATGFGIQVGLYMHIKESSDAKKLRGQNEIAACSGMSAGSMIACCAHHVTDVLPILGLSGTLLFFAQYQSFFMLIGVLSSMIGVTLMLAIIQESNLYREKGTLSKIFSYDMKEFRNMTIAFSLFVLILSAYGFTTDNSTSLEASPPKINDLSEKINNEAGVSISAKPVDLNFNEQVKFYIALNTHQGSLDFDLTKISELKDSNGNTYLPISWEGSPPGGHHRSGTLTFPKIEKTSQIQLIIRNVYGIPERDFMWSIS